jgi:hypothetical protein
MIKEKASAWARAKCIQQDQELWKVEQELEQIYELTSSQLSTSMILEKCRDLEVPRTKILFEQEKTWRLKNRALWIVMGTKILNTFIISQIIGRIGIPYRIYKTPMATRFEVFQT